VIATDAPASEDSVPNRATPVIVYVLAPGSPTTVRRSPTLKPLSSAVFWSSAAWSSVFGAEPSTYRRR
jgi:hypothetical protein